VARRARLQRVSAVPLLRNRPVPRRPTLNRLSSALPRTVYLQRCRDARALPDLNVVAVETFLGLRQGRRVVWREKSNRQGFDVPVFASFSESATSGRNQFALAYASTTTTNIRTELGAQTDKSFVVRDGIVTLRGRAAWAHDSNTDRPLTATFQTLPGATFTVNGARPSADAALLTAGAEMKWRNGWALAGSFDGDTLIGAARIFSTRK
jgi:hypothetical protein